MRRRNVPGRQLFLGDVQLRSKALFPSALPVVLVTAFAVTACATGTTEDVSTDRRQVCVRVSDIKDYEVIDDTHLFVEERVRDNYLFTLSSGCSGLRFSMGISFGNAGNRLCGDSSGWINYEQAGIGARRCLITGIEPVGDLAEARSLAESRTAE